MEAYFAQPTEVKMRDVRPDMHYQIGATPGLVETPKFLLVSVAERFQANVCGVEGCSRTSAYQLFTFDALLTKVKLQPALALGTLFSGSPRVEVLPVTKHRAFQMMLVHPTPETPAP